MVGVVGGDAEVKYEIDGQRRSFFSLYPRLFSVANIGDTFKQKVEKIRASSELSLVCPESDRVCPMRKHTRQVLLVIKIQPDIGISYIRLSHPLIGNNFFFSRPRVDFAVCFFVIHHDVHSIWLQKVALVWNSQFLLGYKLSEDDSNCP